MEVLFEAQKIQNAVEKANRTVKEEEHLTSDQVVRIVQAVTTRCQELNRAAGVEEIQDMVEEEIMRHQAYKVANHYITYRYKRQLVRK